MKRLLLLVFLAIPLLWSIAITYSDFRNGQADKFQEHALAAIAIIAGMVAVYYEVELHHGFRAQHKAINKIVSELATRYLGDWPGDLRHITELARKAGSGSKLLILVDQIGYGSMSRAKDFADYFEALKHAARTGTVHILTYPADAAKIAIERQFDEYKMNWETFLRKEEMKAYLKRYKLDDPRDCQAFIQSALSVHNGFYEAISQAGNTGGVFAARTLLNPSPDETVFYWMLVQGEEPEEMIFVYPRFSGSKTGHAFKTQDLHLMRTFYNQFNRKWETAGESHAVDSMLYPSASVNPVSSGAAKKAGAGV